MTAHLITGGFPPGSQAGHDHDHARLSLLTLLADQAMPASTAGDFSDIGKWLPHARLLLSYVAGPYPDDAQCAVIRNWVESGGHWLGLHGTSGGRATRVEGASMRRTQRMAHHELLGAFFLTHPPLCRFRVDVADTAHPITQGLGTGFMVEDEPYFIELRDPANTQILLTATYGEAAISPDVITLYGADTSLQADGATRVLGFTRRIGQGAVSYIALGHCHGPASRPDRPNTPVFRGPWAAAAFQTLLRNAITWRV